ncbi:major facilitator superfamily domain-containing protein [Rhodofomes roseus]|uniref:Major facilitator superfamily domain-containing protein n=1 Tax=Rhodofomes roseus TaxID=34475 RepID=A0ABQ8KIX7_9APHY|nr:major facilitator superfamily domain-containing protein [Rhodofomes roseus]KAH9837775.1 major facilitator superfamily domain-containing protein [Rhodofomes roseus]
MDTPSSERTHVDFMPADVEAKTQQSLSEKEKLSPATTSYTNSAVDSPSEDDYPDGGLRAWLVVFGCVLFSANTLGWAYVLDPYTSHRICIDFSIFYPLRCLSDDASFSSLVLISWQAWGVVQTYYQEHIFPDASDTVLSTLGSMSGAVFWLAGMLGSAFCTELWQFFITQGLLQGIANALIFPLVVSLPAQWFLKYRAFAIGVVVAGCSFGGALATLIMYKMFAALGLKKTFAIYAAMNAICFIVALVLIKERRPSSRRPKIIWIDITFFKDPVFWSLGLCILFTVFGYLTPIFLLPTYVIDVIPGTSDFLSALPLMLLNFGAAAGRTSVGFIADRIGPVNALLISVSMSGLAQLLIWNFVKNYSGIIAFGVIYGFFCGCFISLTPAVCAQLYGSDRLAGLSGLTLFFNLPGNAAGAPLGGAILSGTGGNWHAVACYSGGMQVLVAGMVLTHVPLARFKKEPKLLAVY